MNVACFDFLLNRGMKLLEGPIERQGVEKAAVIGLSLVALLVVLSVWQFVGVWRSATTPRPGRVASSGQTGQGVTVLGILGGTVGVVAVVWDITRVLQTIRSPDFAAHTIERIGDTDLFSAGAINDESVDEIIMALEGSPIEVLRVNSLAA